MTLAPLDPVIDGLVEVALQASAEIMRIYGAGCAVASKADASPVTAADHAAEAIILAGLARLAPGVPVIAEEEVAAGRVPTHGDRFFLVDPLDGTRDFIDRLPDFTVNIALIEQDTPVFGIVVAPARALIYVGDTTGARRAAVLDRLEWEAIGVRAMPTQGLTVVGSRSHQSPETDAYLRQFNVAEHRAFGSSLKICAIADGSADLYARAGATYEWDIAAGDAVLRAAGGHLSAPDGTPMTYGKLRFYNQGFVAAGFRNAPALTA